MGRKGEEKMQEAKNKKTKDLSQINKYCKIIASKFHLKKDNVKSKQAKVMPGSNPKYYQNDKSDSDKINSSLSTDNLFKTVPSRKKVHGLRSKNLIKMLYSKLDKVQKRNRLTSGSANCATSTSSGQSSNTSMSPDFPQEKKCLGAYEESVNSISSSSSSNISILSDILQERKNFKGKGLSAQERGKLDSSADSHTWVPSEFSESRKGLKRKYLEVQQNKEVDSQSIASTISKLSQKGKSSKSKTLKVQEREELHSRSKKYLHSNSISPQENSLKKKYVEAVEHKEKPNSKSTKYATTNSSESRLKRKSFKSKSLKETWLRKELYSKSIKYPSSSNSNFLSEGKSLESICIEEAQQRKELNCGSTNYTSTRSDFLQKGNSVKRKDIKESVQAKESDSESKSVQAKESDSESKRYATSISSCIPSDFPQGRESLKRKALNKLTLSKTTSLGKYLIPLKMKSYRIQDKKGFYNFAHQQSNFHPDSFGSSQAKVDYEKKVKIHTFCTSKEEKSLENGGANLQHSKEPAILHKSPLCVIKKVKSKQLLSEKVSSYPHEDKVKIDCSNHFTVPSLKSKDDEPCQISCDDIPLSEQNMDIDNIDMNDIERNLNNNGLQKETIVVLDTNVLLGDRSVIENLRSTMFFGKSMKIIIPFVVLQELDKLKLSREKTLKGEAEAAIKWCNNYLENQDPCIQGHKNYECFLNSLNFQDKNVDNIILQCCISFCKDDKTVYLISDDINLRNKALSFNIQSFNLKKLKNLIEPQDFGTLPLNNEYMKKVSSERTTNSSVSVNKPERLSDSLVCVSEPVQLSKTDIKDSIVSCLGGILEYAMKDAYQDLWESIILFKPPWSAIQVLKCFEKHWIAIFIDKFSNDIKTLITEIHKDLETSSQINIHEKLFNLYRLFKHEPYKSIVNKSIKNLKGLNDNCSLPELQEVTFDHIQEMMLAIGRDASSKIQEMSKFLQEGCAQEADISSLNEVNNSLLLLRNTLISFGHLLFGFNNGTCNAPATALNEHMNHYWKLAGIDVPTVAFKQHELSRFLTSIDGRKFIKLYLAEVEKLIRIIDGFENQ